jgi:hypothetical protein
MDCITPPRPHACPCPPPPTLQAVLRYANGSVADAVLRQGNISRAYNGTLKFPSLQVFAPPGNAYVVDFIPLDPRNKVLAPARLNLTLRNCTVGEARLDQSERDEQRRIAKVDVTCQLCRFGFYRCVCWGGSREGQALWGGADGARLDCTAQRRAPLDPSGQAPGLRFCASPVPLSSPFTLLG